MNIFGDKTDAPQMIQSINGPVYEGMTGTVRAEDVQWARTAELTRLRN
jgi:hypothetical protein